MQQKSRKTEVSIFQKLQVDGFRFDLMGHIMKSTMVHNPHLTAVKAKSTLQSLSKDKDGVDGSMIYMRKPIRAMLCGVRRATGYPFFHCGDEILRSKSLDRDSYNSGDWFNRFDAPLPQKLIKPRLANPSFKPQKHHILAAVDNFVDLLKIRYSCSLFRLRTANAIQVQLFTIDITYLSGVRSYTNVYGVGPSWVQGIIVMSIEDGDAEKPGMAQIDPVFTRNSCIEVKNTATASSADGGDNLHQPSGLPEEVPWALDHGLGLPLADSVPVVVWLDVSKFPHDQGVLDASEAHGRLLEVVDEVKGKLVLFLPFRPICPELALLAEEASQVVVHALAAIAATEGNQVLGLEDDLGAGGGSRSTLGASAFACIDARVVVIDLGDSEGAVFGYEEVIAKCCPEY
ncbi:hypothetical protein ZIOFF_044144 [Zingiber officinale]|uniref:Alpha-1,6-glucosidases pullulanase-type C-terminal domain-containing protein n=1 Tax=Zingiber officinale TaxID=94328 RepID=A0A8J5KUB3_ZINOF|nr:hypothetical protein ZIOFF_044144 [Zingiber officinale]